MKQIIWDTWTILEKREKSRFIVLAVADVVISLFDILSLVCLLWIVQYYIQPQNLAPAFLPQWLSDKNSVALIGIFLLVFMLKNFVGLVVTTQQYRFVSSVATRLSEKSLRSFQQSSFDEFVHTDTSVLIRRIAFQPFEFCQYLLSGMQQMITQASLVLLSVAVVLVFDAELFLILLLIMLPPSVLVFYQMRKRLAVTKSSIRSANETSFRFLLDSLKGFVEGNVFGRNEFFLQRFSRARAAFSRELFHSLSLQAIPSRMIEVFAVLGLFLLVFLATWNGNDSSLMIIGLFMAAAYKIIPGSVKLINTGGQLSAYGNTVMELRNSFPDPDTSRQKQTFESIHLDNISFSYTNEKSLLKQVSFGLVKGEFLGIAGRSGSGKTTLFNLLLGFLDPSDGAIVFNEKKSDKVERRSWWSSISYVRQQHFFIHDTVLNNIILQEGQPCEKRLQFALSASGLDAVLSEWNEGLERMVTEHGKNLSGGQQQRVALARALYKDADLYLLDEPCSELDETSEKNLLEHFRLLANSGKMVIMITHHREALQYCTKTFSLHD